MLLMDLWIGEFFLIQQFQLNVWIAKMFSITISIITKVYFYINKFQYKNYKRKAELCGTTEKIFNL